MTQGVDQNRVALMIAMLEKRTGMQLLGDDVFVNIAGGLDVDEPAVDLGLVTAIASSFRNQPIDAHTAVFGEVGLTGEIRGATQAAARPQSRSSRNSPVRSRCAFSRPLRPDRALPDSNKTRDYADENFGPNRTNAPCESHAIRLQRRIDRHRRTVGAIHL